MRCYSDAGNDRVQIFTPDGGFVSAWGTEGTAPGEFNLPWGVAVDDDGTIFVADADNDRIQKFLAAPTPVETSTWGGVKLRYAGNAPE